VGAGTARGWQVLVPANEATYRVEGLAPEDIVIDPGIGFGEPRRGSLERQGPGHDVEGVVWERYYRLCRAGQRVQGVGVVRLGEERREDEKRCRGRQAIQR
jgi:hypothetical protein